ncbi:hypothetical protein ACOSP7_023960 [Xanthoceras sorbifolium]
MHKDLFEYKHEREARGCKEGSHAYKDELASKAKLEKKLDEEARRYKALRKEMKHEMNASKAKHKRKIQGLKDQVKKAMVDLEHAYKLIEQQAGHLAKKDDEFA